VGNGGLTSSDPGAVEEWLAFNDFVRRAGERKGRLSFLSRGGLERDGVDPLSLATLEQGGDAGRGRGSRRGALERGGDRPAGSRGLGWAALCTWAAYWASLSPFLSFGLEGGCRPSRARLPNMCFAF